MLHHTRISTGCDDVTMLRLLFSTLRLRLIHFKNIWTPRWATPIFRPFVPSRCILDSVRYSGRHAARSWSKSFCLGYASPLLWTAGLRLQDILETQAACRCVSVSAHSVVYAVR